MLGHVICDGSLDGKHDHFRPVLTPTNYIRDAWLSVPDPNDE
jgi:hypothetical protein